MKDKSILSDSESYYDSNSDSKDTPTFSFADVKSPAPITTAHDLFEKLGLGVDKELKPKGFFSDAKKTVPSIFYEEMSKTMGAAKGYSTINLFYEENSNKDLFKHYEDYARDQLKNKHYVMPFPLWADYHFKAGVPHGWHGNEMSWKKMQKIYENSNLVTLSDQEKSRYEAKIINGKLCVKAGPNGHPNQIYHPDNILIEKEWTWANSSFGEKRNRRGDDLIFVLVEDKHHEKKLYIAADIPGIFHHTSFSGQGVIAAGALKIGQKIALDYEGQRDGDILKITAESGHYKPGLKSFVKILKHLQINNAISSDIQGTAYTKSMQMDSKGTKVTTHRLSFANKDEAEQLIKFEETNQLKVFLNKNSEHLGTIWKQRVHNHREPESKTAPLTVMALS